MSGDSALFPQEKVDRKRLGANVDRVLERAVLAMVNDRFPHALLLVGPEGLGRELAAQEIAIMLISDTAPQPFAQTPVADRIRKGLHPDVVVPQGEGRKDLIRIDRVREIVKQAPGRPFEGQSRVWIFDGVDRRLEAAGANALLKVLEEPPAHVRFLLLCANPQAVLPTIRSRCARMMMPGIVGSGGILGEGTTPPEVAIWVDRDPKVTDVFEKGVAGLEQVVQGDVQTAIRLSTLFGGMDGGVELLAAASLELAAGNAQWEGAEACAGIAAELLSAQKPIKILGLRPERQILSCLLKWGTGRGGV
ncbi:MAG: hypothetical protein DRJ61_03615 [Acidobacteria bacterium]|nr:MAG: hypothetical protein DRJ61_03615 [Acidobacteriota bacterium]